MSRDQWFDTLALILTNWVKLLFMGGMLYSLIHACWFVVLYLQTSKDKS